METDFSTPLITVWSEKSIQQKLLYTSVNNVVLFFSYGDRTQFSEQCGTFFSYGDRLINPFNYCISLVPFYTIYIIDTLSLCSSADKYEQYKRKCGILLYLPLKLFTGYWYQSFWYRYWSFVWTGIRSGKLYLYRTLPYQYWSFVGTGVRLGKRYWYRSLLYQYRSFVSSSLPLKPHIFQLL